MVRVINRQSAMQPFVIDASANLTLRIAIAEGDKRESTSDGDQMVLHTYCIPIAYLLHHTVCECELTGDRRN
jgi:hypothetical protein